MEQRIQGQTDIEDTIHEEVAFDMILVQSSMESMEEVYRRRHLVVGETWLSIQEINKIRLMVNPEEPQFDNKCFDSV